MLSRGNSRLMKTAQSPEGIPPKGPLKFFDQSREAGHFDFSPYQKLGRHKCFFNQSNCARAKNTPIGGMYLQETKLTDRRRVGPKKKPTNNHGRSHTNPGEGGGRERATSGSTGRSQEAVRRRWGGVSCRKEAAVGYSARDGSGGEQACRAHHLLEICWTLGQPQNGAGREQNRYEIAGAAQRERFQVGVRAAALWRCPSRPFSARTCRGALHHRPAPFIFFHLAEMHTALSRQYPAYPP